MRCHVREPNTIRAKIDPVEDAGLWVHNSSSNSGPARQGWSNRFAGPAPSRVPVRTEPNQSGANRQTKTNHRSIEPKHGLQHEKTNSTTRNLAIWLETSTFEYKICVWSKTRNIPFSAPPPSPRPPGHAVLDAVMKQDKKTIRRQSGTGLIAYVFRKKTGQTWIDPQRGQNDFKMDPNTVRWCGVTRTKYHQG